jgi:nitroimidazol reductase NimA-like FMN-containing flavoprotein (pyridoxamine 5'-phosphate oxidase superfamily)
MSLSMTKEEREAFLASVKIGVVSIPEDGCGPLAVPVWYDYAPGGELRFVTGKDSYKAKLLHRTTRISFCVHDDRVPYKYVSVEGPILAIEKPDFERDIRQMGQFHLGQEGGNQHAEQMKGCDSILVRMRPERWFTVDYSKG